MTNETSPAPVGCNDGLGGPRERLGRWMSAALHDDTVCAEMKADIEAWFSVGGDRDNTGQVYGIIDPDYGRAYTMIRKLAWEEGYAIGLHGSFTRDLDLVAVPWVERPCEPEHLVRRVLAATRMQSLPSNPGKKPQGRLVWTLLFPKFGDPRFIDLSIMPPNCML